ncbi:hypothetical protein DM01DRAFT_1364592 [Hesseltinella vesiculosa]|uniref:Glycosyltransferase family 49 protein n=1 Tax=Hesseltinella vesiculosa TaxID=101127 RepID=A0A1X2G5C7_9FUNG|nr:hypothetical protein DM01DRAFT_1364592 [Hesseltinella vesiculosa]
MTHGLTMSKLFAKTNYQTARGVQPHWLTASQTPDQEAITAVTVVTLDTWKDLERLTQQWKDSKSKVKELYNSNPAMMERMDIHLSPAPQPGISVLVPRNAERNLARMFARSDYIMELPSNVLPVTDLQHTMVTNKEMFTTLLRNGDVLVIPTFGFTDQQESQYRLPSSKASVLTMLERDQIYMIDKHWKPNAGPTDVDHWKSATTLYPVDRYDFHYEPIVIQSKTVQPYCPERFLDSRSACLFASYLGGNEFWVLPDDYAVELPAMEKSILSDFDASHVIENRLYAKFYWEQCVHQARQLDSLGLWKGKRSEHIRTQCSRVIQNWGKGLIGKPE